MKAKSVENIKAANLLIEHDMFAASIHCSYYSCFQLSKYSLSTYYNIDYTKQDIESKGKDAHAFVINELADKLDIIRHFAFIDYNSFMGSLKKLRKKADYSAKRISEKEACEAKLKAEKVINLLTTNLTK